MPMLEPNSGLFDRCRPYLQEPHRAYHNLSHIEEMVNLMREANWTEPVLELAIWGHDLIYDPKRSDNEERSAVLFSSWMRELKCSPDSIDQVTRLILMTKHSGTTPLDSLSARMLDLDLAILGQPQARFLAYNDQIRLEYAHVPDAIYTVKRTEILLNFYNRERIYTTPYFWHRFENQARENLRGVIEGT